MPHAAPTACLDRTTEPRATRLPGAPLLTLLLGAAAFLIRPSAIAASALQYDRTAIGAGEFWRVLTCHWTHWSPGHLAWSGSAFLVLGAACERRGRVPFLACVLASAVLIPLALGLFQPDMHTYRGISGIDSALFVMLAVSLLDDHLRDRGPARLGWVAAIAAVLLGFVGKVVIELATGSAVFVDSAADGFAPAPLAHLAGAAAGLLVAGVSALSRRLRR